MANLVKKLSKYLGDSLDEIMARRRQRQIDERWTHEFKTIYEWRVEYGFTREEADRAYDGLPSTELSNIFLADDLAELKKLRDAFHQAIDRRLEIDQARAKRLGDS